VSVEDEVLRLLHGASNGSAGQSENQSEAERLQGQLRHLEHAVLHLAKRIDLEIERVSRDGVS
jgi:hypothetical protein